MISIEHVRRATARIEPHLRRTPVLDAGGGVLHKLEYLQHTGSFKARGMLNQVLAGPLPEAGIVAASGGNAGLAAAYAARVAGVRAVVYVPETAPAFKVGKLHKLGAQVIQLGNEYATAFAGAQAHAAHTGAKLCHAYDDAAMVAGNGSIGLELLDQVPGGFDTVLVAVGGGGLIGGVVAALAGRARIVAVEPANCPTLHLAQAAGGPVDVSVSGVAADSLGARRIGEHAFRLTTAARVTSLLVDDQAVVEARQQLWDEYRIVVEHGTATAYAALTSRAYVPADGERVVVLLCGANTDPAGLA